MKIKPKIIIIIGVIVAVSMSLYFLYPRFIRYYVRIHQEQTILDLQELEQKYSNIETWEQGVDAIRMLKYIEDYYVVRTGYKSYSATDTRLECQRERTLNAIFDALRDFTGKDFGDDPYQWENAVRDMSWDTDARVDSALEE